MVSYLTFYMIEKFHVSVQHAQISLFIFAFSVAAGTLLGGPLGDRFGRKYVIWFSILGVAPFTLLLPHANLFWTAILTIVIGFVLASAFSAILVYAQELLPGQDWFDLRTVFRFRFWDGRTWFCIAGCAGRSQGNYLCLSGLCISAADWITNRFPSEYRWEKEGHIESGIIISLL